MRRWTRAGLLIVVLAGLGILQTPAARAGFDESQRIALAGVKGAGHDVSQSISVAFGRGLNTNQPMNPVNHAMVPDEVKVDHDGVVHFLVAGFHQVVVYTPGTRPEDIVIPPGNPLFIDDSTNPRYYLGINPAGGPPPGTPATPVIVPPPGVSDARSNAANRVESVSFPAEDGIHPVTKVKLSDRAEPGTYLVICNIRQHFLDGMFGFITVKDKQPEHD